MKSKGDLTKEKILKVATRLVHKNGIGDTSINDLISATGLKKGSLYFHFQSKDALILAIMEKTRAGFVKFLDSALSGETPGESLDNFLERVLEKHRSAGFVGGCIFGNTALEVSDKDKRFSSFVKDVFAEWIEKIREVVVAAQISGQVRNDIPTSALACHIVSSIEGGIMLARLRKNEEPLKDCLNSIKTMIGLKT